jgi:hypothetical protein
MRAYQVGEHGRLKLLLLAMVLNPAAAFAENRWLAGDHHIHSQFSPGYDFSVNPPRPIIGGDAVNPLPANASLAKKYGLSWIVGTDHGGPNHSKINRDTAYPELLKSRKEVPEVIQFYGMELNTPGADHSSLIIPYTEDEQHVLFKLEHGFDKLEVFPVDVSRDVENNMLTGLAVMAALPSPPVVIANHPSRSATAYGEYGADDPAEFRRWNDTAPNVAVGMAGAPGHQAIALAGEAIKKVFATSKTPLNLSRGVYLGYPTLGGFDQMTARVGGFWDSMLGEGRRWWITSNSDFHRHYSDEGVDFYPGEYSKTFVWAEKNHDAILAALRSGQVFVTTGDLVSEAYVTIRYKKAEASIGGELAVDQGSTVQIEIRVRDPNEKNSNGSNPTLSRIDLIVGNVGEKSADLRVNSNSSTRVLTRFTSKNWIWAGEYLTMRTTLAINESMYLRVRGTNTDELEPAEDPAGENPWDDLWFYTNPIFVTTK